MPAPRKPTRTFSTAVSRSLLFLTVGAACLLNLTACGIGESQDDSVQAKIQRDNEKLSGTYAGIAGTYTGSLATGGTAQALPAQLQLYVVTVQDGFDPNNAPKTRVALRAQFKLMGVGELDDTNFVVDYSDFDGRLSLQQVPAATTGAGVATITDCQVGPRDSSISINGHVIGGEIKDASVSGTNGLVGTLNLHRTDSSNRQPLHDQAERLRQAYQRILGSYDGSLNLNYTDPVTHQQIRQNTDSQVIVRMVERPTGEGATCPQLIGQFKLKKLVGEFDDAQFAVNYRESTGELYFTPPTATSGPTAPAAIRSCPMGPKDARLAIDGKIVNGRLRGQLKGSLGTIGDMDLAWKSADTHQVDDQRDRVVASYARMAGTYNGHTQLNFLDPTTHQQIQKDADTEVVIRVVDRLTPEGYTCPSLMAQLKLTKLIGELDDAQFAVTYREATGEIFFTPPAAGETSGGAVRICPVGPKDARLAVDGHLTTQAAGRELSGELKGSQGTLGQIKVNWVSADSRQVDDQRDRILAAYSKIAGTYQGALKSEYDDLTSHNPVRRDADAQMIVRVVDRQTGAGYTCPSLVGEFKLKNVVGKLDDSQFAVTYRESTGEIFFTPDAQSASSGQTSRVCSVGPKDPQLAVDGNLAERRLTGLMKGTQGSIGDLDLKWKSADTRQVDDQRDRLLAAYSPVAGTYGGRFDDANASGKTYDFPVRINISMTENLVNGFVRCPALKAQYMRPDLIDGIGTLLLNADYFPFENQISLRSTAIEGAGPGAGIPGHLQMTVIASLRSGNLKGSMNWWDRVGTLSVTKCRGSRVDKNGACQ